MIDIQDKDKVVVDVLAARSLAEGCTEVEVSLRHPEWRPDRWWSHCELVLRLPAATPLPPLPARAAMVLVGHASRGRESDAMGAYSCKVGPATRAPLSLPDRAGPDALYLGLVERDEPPNQGAVRFHLGSGVTCYVELPGDVDPSAVESGQWWEFIFDGGFDAACFEVC